MITFGAMVVVSWFRLRSGDASMLSASYLIGALYAGIGIFGLFYRNGDPFMGFFLVLGTLLLASSFALRPGTLTA
jgi:hypothetical protein